MTMATSPRWPSSFCWKCDSRRSKPPQMPHRRSKKLRLGEYGLILCDWNIAPITGLRVAAARARRRTPQIAFAHLVDCRSTIRARHGSEIIRSDGLHRKGVHARHTAQEGGTAARGFCARLKEGSFCNSLGPPRSGWWACGVPRPHSHSPEATKIVRCALGMPSRLRTPRNMIVMVSRRARGYCGRSMSYSGPRAAQLIESPTVGLQPFCSTSAGGTTGASLRTAAAEARPVS